MDAPAGLESGSAVADVICKIRSDFAMRCTRPVLERCKTGPVEIVERPCGKCPACLANRAQDWTYRLYAESKLHEKSCFVTLTYNEDNIGRLDLSPTGLYSLRKKDMQDFMKRLRKNLTARIRFYGVGEYGGTSKRPHFHLILFGIDKDEERIIQLAWPFGFIQVGDVSPHSIAYVARYCTKKLFSESLDYKNEGVLPEFCLMSRRPGIGANAIKKGVIRDENGKYFCWYQGKRRGLPKYFKDKVRTAYENFLARNASVIGRDERVASFDGRPYGPEAEDRQREINQLARAQGRNKL